MPSLFRFEKKANYSLWKWNKHLSKRFHQHNAKAALSGSNNKNAFAQQFKENAFSGRSRFLMETTESFHLQGALCLIFGAPPPTPRRQGFFSSSVRCWRRLS